MAQNELVLVHDAARPCVSPEIIRKTCEAAQEYGAAIAAVPATDTVKIADAHSNISKTLDRREVWLAQTPQVFWRLRFHMALLEARRQGVEGTDCASLAEALGQKVRLVEGDLNNLKVTYAADLERAAAILKARL